MKRVLRLLRIGLLSAGLLLGLAGAIVYLLSVSSPFQAYIGPARDFLRAALVQDSLELRRRAVSAQPVRWALHASETDPKGLAVWAKLLRPYSGDRHGDTVLVVFQTRTTVCYLRPIAMTFVQSASGPRVLSVSSSCFADD